MGTSAAAIRMATLVPPDTSDSSRFRYSCPSTRLARPAGAAGNEETAPHVSDYQIAAGRFPFLCM
jgi:hypothetical protein